MTTSPFVSTEWLADHLSDAGLRIVDASWYMPAEARDPNAEFIERHIPGAVRFDPDAIADLSIPLPHMLASSEDFAAAVGALGISETDHIVVYDGAGMRSSPRAWWNFRIMGAQKVSVLSGGLPKWTAEGRQLESGVPAPTPARFLTRFDPAGVADVPRVLASLENDKVQIADARSAGRFRGEAPEPRAGLASGHMPGARNLPFDQLVVDGRMLEKGELAEIFAAAGLDTETPLIASCGSGMTAAIIVLAFHVLAPDTPAAVYDGSWTEWGGRNDLPVVTGP